MPFYKLTVNRGPVLSEYHSADDKAAITSAVETIARHKRDEGGVESYELYRRAADDDAADEDRWDLLWGEKPLHSDDGE
ncbi:hypothetical protein [Blastococcus sp. SYSU DS1021]